jgi:hypothetical protein
MKMTSRFETEQAIAADLNAIDTALFFAKGAQRRPLLAHKKACLAQIKAWNKEDGLDKLSSDEILEQLAA